MLWHAMFYFRTWKEAQKRLRDPGSSCMYSPVPAVLIIHLAPTHSLTAVCYKTKALFWFAIFFFFLSPSLSHTHSNYFWSNQRQCIVSHNITIIQVSSSQKQSLLFNTSDGYLQHFVGGRGGGLHCCLFQVFNNWEAGISISLMKMPSCWPTKLAVPFIMALCGASSPNG